MSITRLSKVTFLTHTHILDDTMCCVDRPWLLGKPHRVIQHVLDRYQRAVCDVFKLIPDSTTMSVTVHNYSEGTTYKVHYSGLARRHGEVASPCGAPFLGCTCIDHSTFLIPCKHMCACWEDLDDSMWGASQMPPEYFAAPSISMCVPLTPIV